MGKYELASGTTSLILSFSPSPPLSLPRWTLNTGWQVDPFGHSAFMGAAYALMGFDSWFFGRIDYQVSNMYV